MLRSRLSLFFLLSTSLCSAMIFDNRWLPLYPRPNSRKVDKLSDFDINGIFLSGDDAYGISDDYVNIPEINGKYDQGVLADAMVKTGLPNPLRPTWRGHRIPWTMEGHLNAEAFAMSYEQALGKYFAFGTTFLFMHLNSRQDFIIGKDVVRELHLNEGDLQELERDRRQMHADLGFANEGLYSNTGIGDIDFYLRFGRVWDYCVKFRKIDLNGKLGLLIPTGAKFDYHNFASIPFGGDGHWGMYWDWETEFELKEDFVFGFLMRLIKRFENFKDRRMPVNNEPNQFGALIGRERVDPGVTFAFAPYIGLDGIRDGFGARAGYTVVLHDEDTMVDKRADVNTITTTLDNAEKASSWQAEYWILNVFYDFGKLEVKPKFSPLISLTVDIPGKLFAAKRVARTFNVMFGIEFNF